MDRPKPPAELFGIDGAMTGDRFIPAPELDAWARETFIDQGAALENEDHAHLTIARIGFLWTNAPNSRHGRSIVGQAEFKPPGSSQGKWQRARAKAQIYGWFGQELDFLLTFYAEYAATCSDAEFCALVEHELYHCGQERDEYGAPKFSESGMPVFCMRGHDVEEFHGIVKRYGADAAHVAELVALASQPPIIAEASIRAACGNCHA